ncbi:MAG: hypothetical protein PHE26_07115, partial [Syntrophomonadaceae bacterium]|nr:hypothetical protein [Syntrophomonadaceae bacterium]
VIAMKLLNSCHGKIMNQNRKKYSFIVVRPARDNCERSANLSLRAQHQPVIASAARQSSPVIVIK